MPHQALPKQKLDGAATPKLIPTVIKVLGVLSYIALCLTRVHVVPRSPQPIPIRIKVCLQEVSF